MLTEKNKPCVLMGDVRTEHFTYLTKEHWEEINNSDYAERVTKNDEINDYEAAEIVSTMMITGIL